MVDGINLGQAAKYQIIVQGREIDGLADWTDEIAVETESMTDGPTVTIFTGLIRDQAALHGFLNRIRDLGIPLISVQLVDPPFVQGRSRRNE